MRRALILLVLLFAIAIGAFAPSKAQTGGGKRNPCVAQCREALRDAHERCRKPSSSGAKGVSARRERTFPRLRPTLPLSSQGTREHVDSKSCNNKSRRLLFSFSFD